MATNLVASPSRPDDERASAYPARSNDGRAEPRVDTPLARRYGPPLCVEAPAKSDRFTQTFGSAPSWEVIFYKPGVRVKEGESFERAMRRFKKQCERAGVLGEIRKREYYERRSVTRKKRAAAERKRLIKKLKSEGTA